MTSKTKICFRVWHNFMFFLVLHQDGQRLWSSWPQKSYLEPLGVLRTCFSTLGHIEIFNKSSWVTSPMLGNWKRSHFFLKDFTFSVFDQNLGYGKTIWQSHMAEPYGNAIWQSHMAAAAAAAAAAATICLRLSRKKLLSRFLQKKSDPLNWKIRPNWH